MSRDERCTFNEAWPFTVVLCNRVIEVGPRADGHYGGWTERGAPRCHKHWIEGFTFERVHEQS